MEWISVKDKMPGPGSGRLLIVFLEPFFGGFTQEIGVGYYDHDDEYEEPNQGTGWRFWIPDREIKGGGVTHWAPVPELPNED